MSANHALTTHPERYTHAPMTHPVVNQNTFECVDCGNLVLDLSKHDERHDLIDELRAAVERLTAPAVLDKITEPYEEESSAPSKSTRGTAPRKSAPKATS